MMKVAEITMSGRTPISAATRGFSAVARIARPSLVRCTRYIRLARMTTVRPRIRHCTTLITGPPRSIGSFGNRIGYGLGLGFQTIIASVCNSRLMPIAVISGASRGALRSGR